MHVVERVHDKGRAGVTVESKTVGRGRKGRAVMVKYRMPGDV